MGQDSRTMMNKLIRRAKDIKYDVYVWFQRAFRGYADVDWFSYEAENSRRAVKLLALLRDDKYNGYPTSIQTCDFDHQCSEEERAGYTSKWRSMIDDMIFFHKCIAGCERPESERFTTTVDVTKGSVWQTLCPDGILHHNSYDSHTFKDEKEQRRFRRGKYYYFRYYTCLWS